MTQDYQLFDEMTMKNRPAIPDLLYHYTTMEGLLGIVRTGKLWLTHVKYLNDSREYEFLWQLLAARIERRFTSSGLPFELGQQKRIEALLGFRAPIETFVCSFSDDHGDRLSQWRGYSANGTGFSIGLSGPMLENLVEQYNATPEADRKLVASILPAIYFSDDDAVRFDEIIDNTWKSPVEAPGLSKERMFSTLMSAFAWAYKHNSFCEEKEWRLTLSSFPFSAPKPKDQLSPAMQRILYRADDSAPGLCFRPGKSMLIPYREVELASVDAKFIKKITIGPTPHPELSAKAVKDLLLSTGLTHCEIRLSTVPYRHW
jgi:hypothetical protein